MKAKAGNTRRVLECGGKRSATPPWAPGSVSDSFIPSESAAAVAALPAHSKTRWTCRTASAFMLIAFTFKLPTACAQSYSIDWFKIAGGGGTSTNGQYAVNGTIGQHDAGNAMTGGNFSLTGGFWSLISVVPTPGAPALTITHIGNSVKVSWPSPSTGFVLQQNSDLTTANWSTAGFTVSDDGTNKSISVTSPAANLFFRLKQ